MRYFMGVESMRYEFNKPTSAGEVISYHVVLVAPRGSNYCNNRSEFIELVHIEQLRDARQDIDYLTEKVENLKRLNKLKNEKLKLLKGSKKCQKKTNRKR